MNPEPGTPENGPVEAVEVLADRVSWLAAQAEQGVGWLRDLGVYAYVIGGGIALLWIFFALWYTSRRRGSRADSD